MTGIVRGPHLALLGISISQGNDLTGLSAALG